MINSNQFCLSKEAVWPWIYHKRMTEENISSFPSEIFILLDILQSLGKDRLLIPCTFGMVVEVFADGGEGSWTDECGSASRLDIGEQADH